MCTITTTHRIRPTCAIAIATVIKVHRRKKLGGTCRSSPTAIPVQRCLLLSGSKPLGRHYPDALPVNTLPAAPHCTWPSAHGYMLLWAAAMRSCRCMPGCGIRLTVASSCCQLANATVRHVQELQRSSSSVATRCWGSRCGHCGPFTTPADVGEPKRMAVSATRSRSDTAAETGHGQQHSS